MRHSISSEENALISQELCAKQISESVVFFVQREDTRVG